MKEMWWEERVSTMEEKFEDEGVWLKSPATIEEGKWRRKVLRSSWKKGEFGGL